jgi:hypothetical protein
MSANSVAKKLGFLDQPMEQTQAHGLKRQIGGNWWDDVESAFGGSVGQHPCVNGHIGLGVTKASYNKAIKLHKQHGGSFMDMLKKVGKFAINKGLPLLSNVLPGKAGIIAKAANELVNGTGLYIGHGAYGITKAHYTRAVKHHKMHGGSFWSSIKNTATNFGNKALSVAKKALPIIQQLAPMLPGPLGMAANLALTGLDAAGVLPQPDQSQDGSGLKRLQKGSAAAKARMAHLRSLKKTKGKGLY